MNLRSHLAAFAVIGAVIALPGMALAQGKPAEILDINTASKQQLMTLEGIGDARSDAIIKGRPYRAKNELVDKSIVPEGVYDKIKDKIIARQVAQTPAKKN